MVYAVSRVQAVDYAEIIATVASKSVGPGTRKNIDEFTRTTSGAVAKVGGAKTGKAINVINPAEPPLMMRDTIYCETAERSEEHTSELQSLMRNSYAVFCLKKKKKKNKTRYTHNRFHK